MAETADVVVVGGGIAGMVAARECLKVGLATVLIEASDRLGGLVASATIAGVRVDIGAESFATRGGSVADLLAQLGLADEVITPNPAGSWLALPDRDRVRLVPMPGNSLLGIPASPLSADVRAVIGWRGALRAYLDRVTPVLTVGKAESVGRLVRSRMGQRVHRRLLAPIARGVYSTDPDSLDIRAVAPGLNEAITRAGSLSGGVAELIALRPSGSPIASLAGGMYRLVDALAAEIDYLGGTVLTGRRVTALTRDRATPRDSQAARDRPASGDQAGQGAGWLIEHGAEQDSATTAARHIIVATPTEPALALLTQALSESRGFESLGFSAPDFSAASTEVISLLVRSAQLDGAPRGNGIVVADGVESVAAKALTHTTAKWDRTTEAGHFLRLSYRSDSAVPDLGDERAIGVALDDASRLLGSPLTPAELVGWNRASWPAALPPATIGYRDRVAAVQRALECEDTVAATGSWLAGNGLAAVIPHAIQTARAIRRRSITKKQNII